MLGGQYDNKRALHNAMERKRRDSIKDSFRGLQVKNHFFINNAKSVIGYDLYIDAEMLIYDWLVQKNANL